ncbi:unnamed protein product [Callosobruchus maculatus]|uniref:Invertebrate defensins family profile domain-containing protein n=1 Tax=Callosobruchus maculatus TaxID=64391 RepID=A0A653DW96_CALMS|nr:unnamed protein product [Callosobruchus maculatus]
MVSKAFLFGMLVVLFTIVAVSEVQAGACEKQEKGYKNNMDCKVKCRNFCSKHGCRPNLNKACRKERCICAPKLNI